MTEHEDSRATDPSEPSPQSGRSGSWWSVLAPAAAFLVGLLLGGLLIGVVADDDDAATADPEASASPGAGEVTGSPSPGSTTIVVPDECLAAVDTVDQALDLADRSAAAIRDFQPGELRSLLRELEEIDQQARAQAEACRDVQADSQPQ